MKNSQIIDFTTNNSYESLNSELEIEPENDSENGSMDLDHISVEEYSENGKNKKARKLVLFPVKKCYEFWSNEPKEAQRRMIDKINSKLNNRSTRQEELKKLCQTVRLSYSSKKVDEIKSNLFELRKLINSNLKSWDEINENEKENEIRTLKNNINNIPLSNFNSSLETISFIYDSIKDVLNLNNLKDNNNLAVNLEKSLLLLDGIKLGLELGGNKNNTVNNLNQSNKNLKMNANNLFTKPYLKAARNANIQNYSTKNVIDNETVNDVNFKKQTINHLFPEWDSKRTYFIVPTEEIKNNKIGITLFGKNLEKNFNIRITRLRRTWKGNGFKLMLDKTFEFPKEFLLYDLGKWSTWVPPEKIGRRIVISNLPRNMKLEDIMNEINNKNNNIFGNIEEDIRNRMFNNIRWLFNKEKNPSRASICIEVPDTVANILLNQNYILFEYIAIPVRPYILSYEK